MESEPKGFVMMQMMKIIYLELKVGYTIQPDLCIWDLVTKVQRTHQREAEIIDEKPIRQWITLGLTCLWWGNYELDVYVLRLASSWTSISVCTMPQQSLSSPYRFAQKYTQLYSLAWSVLCKHKPIQLKSALFFSTKTKWISL